MKDGQGKKGGVAQRQSLNTGDKIFNLLFIVMIVYSTKKKKNTTKISDKQQNYEGCRDINIVQAAAGINYG